MELGVRSTNVNRYPLYLPHTLMASRKEECKDEAAAAARQTDSQEIVSKTLDEAKDNTKRAIEEARRDISARTAIFNEYQEQSITAARDIAENYLES